MPTEGGVEYDQGRVVIDQAVAICVKWNYKVISDTKISIEPVVYRNDYSWDGTDDTGWAYVQLNYEPNGTQGNWYNVPTRRYEGDPQMTQIDSFVKRIYDRKISAYVIDLKYMPRNWQSHGTSGSRNWVAFTQTVPAAAAPAAPVAATDVNFVTRVKGTNSFKLQWAKPTQSSSDVSSTFKYAVICRRTNNGDWVDIAKIDGSKTTYTDTTTKTGNAYAYTVRYSNGVVESSNYPAKSNATNNYTDLLKPTIDSVTLSNNGTIANVHWVNNNASTNFDSQQVYYSKNGGVYSSVGSIEQKTTRNLSVDISSDTSALYRFKVAVKQNSSSTQDAVAIESAEYVFWTKPVVPTAVSHSRTNDTANVVTWTYSSSENNLTEFSIFRSVNGASFTKIGSATPNIRTYTDKTCKADCSYSYKVRAVNAKYTNDTAKEVASELTYNTPAAPYIIGGYRIENSAAVLTLENTSNVASKTNIYVRKKDSSNSVLALQTVGKATRAEIDVSSYSTTVYFTACNIVANGDEELVSAMSAEYTVEPTQLPTYPVSILPVEGSNTTYDERTVQEKGIKLVEIDGLYVYQTVYGDVLIRAIVFSWVYAPEDGSPQVDNQLYIHYTTNYGKEKDINIGTDSSIVYDGSRQERIWKIGATEKDALPCIADGTEVKWRVEVKSASGEWVSSAQDGEEYSSSFIFRDSPRPVVEVTNTDENSNLLSFPICVSVSDVTDMARFDVRIAKSATGEQADAVTVFQKSGYTENVAKIELEEFIPEIDTIYYVFVTAYNQFGFLNKTEAVAKFHTSAVSIGDLVVDISNNIENGSATLSISPNVEQDVKPSSLILIRESDHKTSLLDVDAASAVFVDKYAPINLEYTYKIMAFSDGGGFSIKTITNIIRSPYWFFLWDDKMARGIWDCEDPWSVSRPDKTLKYYAGRKDPVSYDTSAISITHKAHFWVKTRQEAIDFYNLMLDGGRCIFKSGEGFVFKADVDIDVTPTYRPDSWYGEVECDITKIAGGDSL